MLRVGQRFRFGFRKSQKVKTTQLFACLVQNPSMFEIEEEFVQHGYNHYCDDRYRRLGLLNTDGDHVSQVGGHFLTDLVKKKVKNAREKLVDLFGRFFEIWGHNRMVCPSTVKVGLVTIDHLRNRRSC